MRNIKMVLQYEGTRYRGWQRQESTNQTIQGKLEAIAAKLCDETIEISGAGRTDAGVHAYGQVANFMTNCEKSVQEMMHYFNTYLPEDIAVIEMEAVPQRFHSRLHAKNKIYRYRVLNSDIPHIFDRRYVYELPQKLDLDAMQEAAQILTGRHDFKSFTSAKRGKKSTVRTIEQIKIERVSTNGAASPMGDEIWLTYQGDGFLYHMVRILTGTLLEVGMGKRSVESIPALLEVKDREQAGFLAPAKGLSLIEVGYGR